MQGMVRTFAACALLALLVPAAALAEPVEVSGPLVVQGQGYFGGELELEAGEGRRPVRIAGRQGYVGILDLGGDLKVRCLGHGRVAKSETKQGTVYLCKGSGEAVVRGSHFTFRGFGKIYRIRLSEGASGTLSGRFTRCSPDGCERPETERPGEQKERGEREKAAPIPTVAQVAAELAAALAG